MMSRFLHNERFDLSGAQTICLVVSPAKQFSKTELYKSPPAPFGEHLHKLITNSGNATSIFLNLICIA